MKAGRAACLFCSLSVLATGANMDRHIRSCKEVKRTQGTLAEADELHNQMLTENTHTSLDDVKQIYNIVLNGSAQ